MGSPKSKRSRAPASTGALPDRRRVGGDLMRHRRGFVEEDPSSREISSGNSPRATTPKNKRGERTNTIPVPVAVAGWYILGVLSITTSKILLSTHSVPALALTLQQLSIGVSLLYFLVTCTSASLLGLRPVPLQCDEDDVDEMGPTDLENGSFARKSSKGLDDNAGLMSSLFATSTFGTQKKPKSRQRIHTQLLLAGLYFTLGFALTNAGFKMGSASFVETLKAAEPISSAGVAVYYKLEQLGREEVASLGGIVFGVAMSTLGHRSSHGKLSQGNDWTSSFFNSIVVLTANLCFSFRGLHQKLFRKTPQGSPSLVDDLNIQFRTQQIGVLLLIAPTLFLNGIELSMNLRDTDSILHYCLLALVNGIAFTSYNLASTYILSRISVVHHASLNCLRRVFAIISTSISECLGFCVSFLLTALTPSCALTRTIENLQYLDTRYL